jgi:hypothetical protein
MFKRRLKSPKFEADLGAFKFKRPLEKGDEKVIKIQVNLRENKPKKGGNEYTK